MVDLSGVFRRARSKGRELAEEAPQRARHAAHEARSTAAALGDVLDERTDGRLGGAVTKGGEIVGTVARAPGEARDAFREERRRQDYRPDAYRPEPIDAPEPIDGPEPI